jgi:hypothetical protein
MLFSTQMAECRVMILVRPTRMMSTTTGTVVLSAGDSMV